VRMRDMSPAGKVTVGTAVDWEFAATVGVKLARPGPATTDYTRGQVIDQLASASRSAEAPVREVTGHRGRQQGTEGEGGERHRSDRRTQAAGLGDVGVQEGQDGPPADGADRGATDHQGQPTMRAHLCSRFDAEVFDFEIRHRT